MLADLFLAEFQHQRKPTTDDTYALHMHNQVLPTVADLRAREIAGVRGIAPWSPTYWLMQLDLRRPERTQRVTRAGVEGQKKAKLDADDDVAQSHDIPDLVAFLMGLACRRGTGHRTGDDTVRREFMDKSMDSGITSAGEDSV